MPAVGNMLLALGVNDMPKASGVLGVCEGHGLAVIAWLGAAEQGELEDMEVIDLLEQTFETPLGFMADTLAASTPSSPDDSMTIEAVSMSLAKALVAPTASGATTAEAVLREHDSLVRPVNTFLATFAEIYPEHVQ